MWLRQTGGGGGGGGGGSGYRAFVDSIPPAFFRLGRWGVRLPHQEV